MNGLSKIRVKKNDVVRVIAGKEKGKKGKVLLVLPTENRVVVEKLNIYKRHTRPNAQNQQGGIVEKEGKMNLSNVMVVCDKCDKAVRVAMKRLEDGTKVRMCNKCGEVMDL